ncbi:Cell morphogenesis protein PAG1, partial [Dispira simplex]
MLFATQTTPADSKQYIIGRLYHDFSESADIHVRKFADYSSQVVPDLVPFFAPAMEGKLGQTIRNMAKVGRSCAKEVVESLLQWRRGLLEDTETTVEPPIPQSPGPGPRQLHSPLPTWLQTTPSGEITALGDTGRRGSTASAFPPVPPSGSEPAGNAVRLYHLETAQERQTIGAVYILCSALIAVFNELQPQDIPDEIGSVVEELTFVQLTNIDLESLSGCPNRQVIAQLYAELIGSISCVRFATMSDRFIAELERIPSGPLANEHQVELTIRGMRFLRFKIYPVDALEETAQFLYSCTKFFARRSQGTAIKCAYYEVFTQLLLPIAAVADAEVNFPDWVRSMDMLLPRATKAAAKPRYLHVAWPFLTAVLCTSRREVFLSHLSAFLDQAFQRMRDRSARNVALGCVCRMVWAYLFRYTESEKETYRRLESLVRLMFGTRKRPLALVDLPLDYYVYIVFCLLRFSQDWTIRNVFSFLLHTDDWNPLPLTLDSLSPERATIGLRALLLYLQSNAQEEKRPPFPSSQDLLVTNSQPFALPSYPRLAEDVGAPALPWDDSAFQLTEQVEMAQSKYYFLLDVNYGDDLVTKKRFVTFDHPQRGVTSLHSAPNSLDPSATSSVDVTPAGTINGDVVGGTRLGNRTQPGHRSHLHSLAAINQTVYPTGSSLVGLASTTRELTTEGQEYQHHFYAFSTVYGKERQPFYDLLTTSIDITPDVLPSQIVNEKLAEMLVKYLLHVDLCVARAASRGLVRLARRIGAYHIIGLMASTLTQVQDRMREILNHHIYLPEPKETQSQTKPQARRKSSRGQPWSLPVLESDLRSTGFVPGAKGKNFTTTASMNTADQFTAVPRSYRQSHSGNGGLLHLYVELLELLLVEIEELDAKYQLGTVADR